MPTLSRWMIRLALFHAWVGTGVAALLLSNKGRPELFPDWMGGWILAHVNLLLVGWMIQLAMGVAYWIMPRLPNSLTERGRYGAMLGAAGLLNSGVWLYSAGIMAVYWWPDGRLLQPLGLGLQWLALLAFAYHHWPRLRPVIVPTR
jgi:hypothetical protein